MTPDITGALWGGMFSATAINARLFQKFLQEAV
jgi:hypothetical protein